jgi:hypothetical protein
MEAKLKLSESKVYWEDYKTEKQNAIAKISAFITAVKLYVCIGLGHAIARSLLLSVLAVMKIRDEDDMLRIEIRCKIECEPLDASSN